MNSPGFSIIVPTYQRRAVVTDTVMALTRLNFDGRLEVIVVVDGSTDGTKEALAELKTPFVLRVIVQPNRGAAAARNAGAADAKEEILLFLDDDMIAHPDLLQAHAAA